MIIQTKCIDDLEEIKAEKEEFEFLTREGRCWWKTWCTLNEIEKARLEKNPSAWLGIYNLLANAQASYKRALK